MRKLDKKRLFKQPLIVSAVALAIAAPASADDLDVFNAVLASQVKPNIVFVLDYSGSMKQDTDNNDVDSSSTTQAKIDILNEAVNAVLEANADKVNAGIASIYRDRTSGVKWPVSDLKADAHETDPAIPAGQFTNADVISKQLKKTGASGNTPTVNALAEAAAYFRGDPVSHNGYDPNYISRHKPDTWDVAAEEYNGGNFDAAMPSSYSPSNAFQLDFDGDGYAYCTDHDDGIQGCTDKPVISCRRAEAGDRTRTDDLGNITTYTHGGYSRCSYEVSGAWNTPNYNSPLESQCQSNFIVLISDGKPTALSNTPTLNTVLNAAGIASKDDCASLSPSIFPETDNDRNDGNCGPEILNYLATTDINP